MSGQIRRCHVQKGLIIRGINVTQKNERNADNNLKYFERKLR